MPYDPQKHHRRSIRLKGYDYTQPGAYFVTLVTYHRDEIFGEVMNGVMKLSSLGQIVHDEWMRSVEIRKEICLYEDEFVVMPNHMHGIVWIVPTEIGANLAPLPASDSPGVALVGADGIRPDLGNPPDSGIPRSEPGANLAPLPIRRAPRSLGSFIAGFKAVVTRRAHRELETTGIWQRNYYDHIIRSERDFQKIWNYIDTNQQRWESDQLHPSSPPNPFNQE